MIGVGLPDWVDAEFLRTSATVAVFVAVVAILLVFIFIRSMGTKLLLILLIGAGALGLFVYRDELKECARTCDCSFLGEDVAAEGCPGLISSRDS
jgi:hypothetical protein